MSKLKITEYTLGYTNLPREFDGYRILQVSDLHEADLKGRIEKAVGETPHDIAVFTGDMIYRENEYKSALRLAKEAVKHSPVYYVNGNHEHVLKCYNEFREQLANSGVIILENDAAVIERENSRIVVIGMNDPTFFTLPEGWEEDAIEKNIKNKRQPPSRISKMERHPKGKARKEEFRKKLLDISGEFADDFKIALSHRPEIMDFFVEADIDLTLTGHTHGGQLRLPLIGALYAPNQGSFPKMAKGLFSKNDRRMIISVGVGKSNCVPRLFNPPEIVLVTLKSI